MKLNLNKKSQSTLFIGLYLVILLIFSGSQATHDWGVVIPFVKVNTAYLFLLLLTVSTLYICFVKFAEKAISLDIVLLILSLRIVMNFIPVMFHDLPSDYFGNFVTACFPFFIYLFLINQKIDVNRVRLLFIVFGFLVAAQCVWAYSIITKQWMTPYDNLGYKSLFVIPIGATNRIAAFVFPLLILGDRTIKKAPLRWVYVAFLFLAIFLTKSRMGLLLAVLYLLVSVFLPKSVRKPSRYHRIVKIALPFAILIGAFIAFKLGYWEKIQSLLLGFAEKGEGLEGISSGRITIYRDTANFIFSHNFWWGHGVSYYLLDYTSPHNIILQILYENGIVGLFGFVTLCVIFMKRIYPLRSENACYEAVFVAFPFVMANAMIEDIILSPFILLFSLVFMAVARQERMKKEKGEIGHV